ncbi:MAG: TonB-dependent receptor [Campylobacterota bacterium]|nr:TonB-dependent receptor [Campylobacterota bacterium]
MTKNVFFQLILFFMLTSLHAKNSDGLEDFESLLDDVSDIATKKSLNIDYLPSVVTVINAETYRDAGIQNLGEALSMLPGIQTSLSTIGYTMTTVRGFKNPNAYLSDKIKILIDGVAINNETAGSSHFYMDLPLQLIEKIEVLRGPGSTMYGAGSFYGTVNVITKLGQNKQIDRVSFSVGSYDHLLAASNMYGSVGDWKLFGDGYYQQNSKELYSVQVKPWSEPESGVSDEAMKDFSVGFKAQNGGLEFITRYKKNHSGNFYSFEGQFDPIDDRDQYHENAYLFSQLSYKTAMNDYKLETKAIFSHRESVIDANVYSRDSTAYKFARVDIDMQEGFVFKEENHEQNFELESILRLPEYGANDILLGVGARYAKVTYDNYDNSVERSITENYDAIVNHEEYDSFRYNEENEPAFWANPTTKKLKDNLSRTLVYAYVQDLISVSEDVDIVLGLRADNYSDFGFNLSKRAAIVYRATESTIFKLLYGSAFRAPTFIEAYANGHINYREGDSNMNPEETNTYEAVAIYAPNFNHRLLLNLFYSQLSNVIDLEEDFTTEPGYQNYDHRISQGIEFEYYFKTKRAHDFYFNATYIDAEYTIPEEPIERVDGGWELPVTTSMPDISKVMFKAMYIFKPSNKLSLGTTWRYFSETTPTELKWVNEDPDMDPSVDAYHVFDQSVTFKMTPQSHLRFTVKNLFDAKVKQPSYYYMTNGGVEREGTHLFVNYEQRF